ncbi:PREDICTED: calcium uptake protein 3, mitochondrial isoform X2 [Nicrophorus vespilloides]|uniref:Calcium uptake protein 3, mitochondrial isoform X2 n=1 Tax=Nicrophorus vespilloides TaxID=110193 RepID=A0ABM1MA94_NICVS|nr:PREDICTED: calcium uptake protein 3, mitochondrial isoform X2 [Nicrophorus vespilloides]
MAAVCKLFRSCHLRKSLEGVRRFSSASKNVRNGASATLQAVCIAGATVTIYTLYKCQKGQSVLAAVQQKSDVKVVKLTTRERRFIRFASVEYDGQLYMTPQDFLESVVEAEPRPRLKRKLLSVEEIEDIRKTTPKLSQGSATLFRSLRDKGIISYTEYLFLLSILTKPQSGFRIAFNMFDADGNEKVDKNEFLVMEKIFSHAWKGKRGMQMAEGLQNKLPIQDDYVDDEQGLQRRHIVDTTLIVHFFGQKGTDELNFEDFQKFMLYLQKEVLELEFSEFSKGLPTISEVDFAKILLRYTYLDTDEYDNYLDRLLDRIKDTRGITFEEFHVFCQFLNNLDDFNIAMRMYTLADHPISKDEFHRAVKICTGTNLSPHLVHTVFSIFDDDGDGLLSYREFIAIMKDRLHRGFKSYAKNEGWEAFKSCIKQEMKTPS